MNLPRDSRHHIYTWDAWNIWTICVILTQAFSVLHTVDFIKWTTVGMSAIIKPTMTHSLAFASTRAYTHIVKRTPTHRETHTWDRWSTTECTATFPQTPHRSMCKHCCFKTRTEIRTWWTGSDPTIHDRFSVYAVVKVVFVSVERFEHACTTVRNIRRPHQQR